MRMKKRGVEQHTRVAGDDNDTQGQRRIGQWMVEGSASCSGTSDSGGSGRWEWRCVGQRSIRGGSNYHIKAPMIYQRNYAISD
jgi:hypothetical protein